MPLFRVTGLGRDLILRANDEGAAREFMAGKGKSRDENWLSQDHGFVSQLESDGSTKVVWEAGSNDEPKFEPAPEIKAEAKGEKSTSA